jgi:hypothetical protein
VKHAPQQGHQEKEGHWVSFVHGKIEQHAVKGLLPFSAKVKQFVYCEGVVRTVVHDVGVDVFDGLYDKQNLFREFKLCALVCKQSRRFDVCMKHLRLPEPVGVRKGERGEFHVVIFPLAFVLDVNVVHERYGGPAKWTRGRVLQPRASARHAHSFASTAVKLDELDLSLAVTGRCTVDFAYSKFSFSLGLAFRIFPCF